MRSCRVDRGVLRAEALHKHIAVLSNFGPRLRASFSSPARHRARPRELPCSMQVLVTCIRHGEQAADKMSMAARARMTPRRRRAQCSTC